MVLTADCLLKQAAQALTVVLVLPGVLGAVVARALTASTAMGAMVVTVVQRARLVMAETAPLET